MKSSLTWMVAAALLLAGCATAPEAAQAPPSATSQPTAAATPRPTSTPEPRESPTPETFYPFEEQPVTFEAEDGLKISGTYFKSEGDVAVLFVHMAGNNDTEKDWIPFAREVAKRGFPALTFDMRCHGATECRGGTEPGWVTTSWDMLAATKYLRDQGYTRIVCIGASMGGRACVNTVFDEELAGIVIISGTASDDPEKKDLSQMLNPGMPKLFAVSDNDPNLNRTADMQALYENAPEPKLFLLLPGKSHGTEFFKSTKSGGELTGQIYALLYGIRDA